jgi:glycosyltransferase involved in cell wall biosynthesis
MNAKPSMISIVIPAHNEADLLAETVAAVHTALTARGEPFEIIVVENGSTDETWAVAQAIAKSTPSVKIERLGTPDYGRALRAGFFAAVGDVVVNFDADFYDFEFLDKAVARVREPNGPVVVVGTKRGEGATDTRALPRRIVTGVFSTILKTGFGLKVSDTHGIKAMRRAPLLPVAERCQLGTDLFDTELILRAERAGLPTGEIPVVVNELRPSRSSIARRIPRTIAGLVKLRRALRSDG